MSSKPIAFPRRKSVRLALKRDPIGVFIKFCNQDGPWIPARIVDFSLDGIGLVLDSSLPVQSRLYITTRRDTQGAAEAICVWNRAIPNNPDHVRVGFHFISETAANRENVVNLVRSILSEFGVEEAVEKAVEIFKAGQAAHREMKQYLDELVFGNLELEGIVSDILPNLTQLESAVKALPPGTPEIDVVNAQIQEIRARLEHITKRAEETEVRFFPPQMKQAA